MTFKFNAYNYFLSRGKKKARKGDEEETAENFIMQYYS